MVGCAEQDDLVAVDGQGREDVPQEVVRDGHAGVGAADDTDVLFLGHTWCCKICHCGCGKQHKVSVRSNREMQKVGLERHRKGKGGTILDLNTSGTSNQHFADVLRCSCFTDFRYCWLF